MPALRKKIALFFLGLFVFVSVVSRLPPAAKAQCPNPLPAPDAPYCTTAEATCVLAPVLTLFGNNSNMCIATVFEIGKALFQPPPPTPWYNPSIQSFAQKVFDTSNPDEIFGERYTYAQVNWIINSMVVFIFPPIASHTAQDLFMFLADVVQMINSFGNYIKGMGTLSDSINLMPKYGFVGQTYYVMAQIPKLIFTDKVASGIDEVKYVASKLSLTSPAYAQGLGYDKLGLGGNNTIKVLWIASRNMAYLISTVILIAAGFMVIFRTKISPQASVTVQMIIPRLAISLLLVTFSFAIAGFVIDLMYVLITAVIGFIYFSQQAINLTVITNLNDAITTMTGDFGFIWHFLGTYIVIAILLLLFTVVGMIAVAFTGPVLGMIGPIILAVMGFVMGFFMWSVYVWARILGQLIVAYLTLIFLVIAGPLMIIFDILPTSRSGFKKWLSCVVGQVSVFTTYALLAVILSMLFVPDFATLPYSGFSAGQAGGTISFINTNFSLPGFSGGVHQGFIINYLLFIGVMSAVPNIVNSIKDMFCKTPDFGDFITSTIKDTIGQVTRAGENAARDVKSSAQEYRVQRTQVDNQGDNEAATNPPLNEGQPTGE